MDYQKTRKSDDKEYILSSGFFMVINGIDEIIRKMWYTWKRDGKSIRKI